MCEMYDAEHGVNKESPMICIVSNKKSDYRIVIPVQPTDTEEYAAQELALYLKQATGAELSICKENEIAKGDRFFSIGETKLLKDSGVAVDKSTLNKEGFYIITKDKNFYLNGANQRGILYSVYDFLEKFCGIRFLTEFSTHIPHTENLSVHEMKIVEVPFLSFRSLQADNTFSNPAFSAKLRTSCVWTPHTDAKYGGGYADDLYQPNDHSFFDLMPPSKYFKDHPDWYNVADNTVYWDTSMIENGRGPSQLCLTNEGMIQEAVKNLKEWILSRPNAKYVMIGQNDMNPFCECPKCQESYRENGGKSGTLLVFINRLAKEIEEWQKTACPDRDITIQTFAYQATLKPPVKYENGVPVPFNKNVIPRKNVMIKIAIDRADFFKPLDDPRAKDGNLAFNSLKEWNALTNRLYMWDYTTNFFGFFVYFANLSVLKKNILIYKKYGIESILSQNSNQSKEHYQVQLKLYLLSKLLWNPYRDEWAIIKEFNTLHFGADVEPYIAKVTDMFEKYYKEKDFYGILHGGADYLKAENMDPQLLWDTIDVFDKAIDVVEKSDRTPEEKTETITRILSYKITPQYMLLNNYMEYYPGDDDGRRKLAKDFFRNTDRLHIKYYRESVNPEIEYIKDLFLR